MATLTYLRVINKLQLSSTCMFLDTRGTKSTQKSWTGDLLAGRQQLYLPDQQRWSFWRERCWKILGIIQGKHCSIVKTLSNISKLQEPYVCVCVCENVKGRNDNNDQFPMALRLFSILCPLQKKKRFLRYLSSLQRRKKRKSSNLAKEGRAKEKIWRPNYK